MNALEPIDIRTGRPFEGRRAHMHRPAIDGESIDGNRFATGRARGLMGGAFMGCMLAQNGNHLPYDAEVEWLEANQGPYIDTGIKGRDTMSVDIVFKYLTNASSNTTRGCFGDTSADESGMGLVASILIGASETNGNPRLVSFNHHYYWGSGYFYTDEHHITMRNGYCALDGSVTTSAAVSAFETRNNLLLFAYGAYSGAKLMYGRIKSCLISDNGVPLRDFIPVRFANENGHSEGAMYDRASGMLFRNAGTGAFAIGPDIS